MAPAAISMATLRRSCRNASRDRPWPGSAASAGVRVGSCYQVGFEAIIPVNRDSGTGVGFLGQFHLVQHAATRNDELAANYLAFIQLASIRLWLRVYEFTALAHGRAELCDQALRKLMNF